MNTKFDVGQRVTYPIVHTADGNITGIAVSKAGVTRYAIGPKWYAEDDLKPSAEEKPEMGNPVTEPVKESEPEPVKLYCVEADEGYLTKGKIYELDADGKLVYDLCETSKRHKTVDAFFRDYLSWKTCLVPLVSRPAKVGEWVYISDPHSTLGAYSVGDVVRVEEAPHEDGIYFRSASGRTNKNCHSESGLCYAYSYEYLVLNGYHGDPA